MRKRVTISLSPDTDERLKQYAFENHTNVSQAITDWIWSVKVKNENVRGQQVLEVAKPQKSTKTARKTTKKGEKA